LDRRRTTFSQWSSWILEELCVHRNTIY